MKTAITLLSITMLAGCVTTQQWQANTYHDEFTGKTACRVEMGTASSGRGIVMLLARLSLIISTPRIMKGKSAPAYSASRLFPSTAMCRLRSAIPYI